VSLYHSFIFFIKNLFLLYFYFYFYIFHFNLILIYTYIFTKIYFNNSNSIELNLCGNCLVSLPDELGMMSNLNSLDLSVNELKEFTAPLCSMKRFFFFFSFFLLFSFFLFSFFSFFLLFSFFFHCSSMFNEKVIFSLFPSFLPSF